MRRKKKKKDVKEWRKRKKQGAEKKKRVNHKNSDLQEWVGRRKEDGGKRKVQESDWRPSLRLEKRGYGSHCGPPSPLLLYFSSPRMPNSFLQPCVMFLPGNKTQPLTQTHARTQAHTHPPQNALLEQLDPNVHACSDTYSTFNARWLAEFGFLSTQTTLWYAQTHTHGHARTHTQTLQLMRGKRRERGRRRLKSRTEQQHGFVDVRCLLLRLSDSQCPKALFVVVRKSTCLFIIFM